MHCLEQTFDNLQYDYHPYKKEAYTYTNDIFHFFHDHCKTQSADQKEPRKKLNETSVLTSPSNQEQKNNLWYKYKLPIKTKKITCSWKLYLISKPKITVQNIKFFNKFKASPFPPQYLYERSKERYFYIYKIYLILILDIILLFIQLIKSKKTTLIIERPSWNLIFT